MPLTSRQQAFFLVALKEQGKTVENLFAHLPKQEAENYKKLLSELKQGQDEDIKKVAGAELKKFSRPREQSFFSEVHNDWLLDYLKKESPDLIAVILRHLPSERVSYLLEKLPEEILSRMPRMMDTYEVDSHLVQLIKQRFETLFLLPKILQPDQEFEFEHLCLLPASQLHRVFLELGYREIALGLVSIPEITKSMVLNRLRPKDRERVEFYLQQADQASPQRIKKAQVHLISREVDPGEPEFFVKELGLMILAKAVLEKNLEDVKIMKMKMSRKEAQALDLALDSYLRLNTEASVLGFRENILAAIKAIWQQRPKA